jgi:serine/threonine-protein kinase HipA
VKGAAKMLKHPASLDVYYQAQKLGRLALAPDRRCLFEYEPEWVRGGFSISPFYLPLKSGVFTGRAKPFNGLFGVFNDSLPDGWGTLLTDRWLKEKGFNPSDFTVVDRLSLVGNRGMGALSYLPAQTDLLHDEIAHQLDYYANEVAKILQADASAALEEIFSNAGSSGGARPKVLLKIDGTDWLIKFRASVDPEEVGIIEYQHAQMAGKCGIEMPETRLFDGKYFGVQRFDRMAVTRIHMHTAAGLLYASHRLPALDYTDLLKATMALTRDINEVEKMFRLMVFNIAIGNKDDHAKNFSFLHCDNSWKLSPAYDLLPSSGFNNNHTTTINGKGKPEIKDCIDVAKHTAFPVKTAERIIDQVLEGIKNDK